MPTAKPVTGTQPVLADIVPPSQDTSASEDRPSTMTRAQAETLYDQGREATVQMLLEFSRLREELEKRIAERSSRSLRSGRGRRRG